MNDQEWIDKYNEFHCDLVEESNKSRELWLEEHLTQAKDSYYNSGESIMPDMTYDRFERWLKTNNPDNPFLDKVGSK